MTIDNSIHQISELDNIKEKQFKFWKTQLSFYFTVFKPKVESGTMNSWSIRNGLVQWINMKKKLALDKPDQIVIWLFDKLNRSTNSETAMPSSSYPWKEGFFKTTTKWPRDKYFALRYFQKSERNPKRVHNYKCHVCMIPGPELSRETQTSLCFIFAHKNVF